ncbi:DUF6460 domain-containing protein [Methylocystis sp. WRRC1]|uniref:DUF6460 domain-containing protein n=1 Tax=unclassified Methylocystis TaxID=2625913 RepID=UPI0001F87FC2|nr:DUF6460 domain-containing protein [Methylocystis sp. ATCC 49242]MCC3245915.1 DUF6460 domain-containing protein [Methylocystis sp. WRRC1]
MTDQGPFANWPHLDKPKPPRPEREFLVLPGSTETEPEPMASNNNALENFLGGSPLNVFVRLFFISLVVGALLMWLELRPIDILRGVQAFFDRIYQLGFGAVKEVASYVLAGAVFVVPAWFVLRLLNIGGGKR